MLNIWKKEHLAQRLNITLESLEQVAENIDSYCTIKQKPTKKGKIRNVAQTEPLLKFIQRSILDNLLSPIPISPDAHGAVEGRSSKTNAVVHSGKRCVFGLDLKSCFPHVHSSRVRKLFEERLGCGPVVASLLTRLTTFDYHLTQGFSTSTSLLNLMCAPLDEKIREFIAPKGLSYSRYVDDITVSGDFITEGTRDRIRALIQKEGLILNHKKEFFSNGEKAAIVTGLNINTDKPLVPREYKRNLRAAKHNALAKPVSDKDAAEKEVRSIKGKEQYIKYIEKS
jgi:hypothetical protein